MKEDHDYQGAIDAQFSETSPAKLLDMWESGKNEVGRKLSRFEREALVEALYRVFGDMPGALKGERGIEPAKSELPPDDTMLDRKEVMRLTGISVSSLKRLAPIQPLLKPVRLSERRVGYPARNIKEWLEQAQNIRTKERR